MATTATSLPGLHRTPQMRRSFGRRLWHRINQNVATSIAFVFITLLVILTILAPILAPFDPLRQNYSNTNVPPNTLHWFGTDNLGRDIFSRVMIGSQISLSIGLFSVVFGLLIGVAMGVLAGYFSGIIDEIIMRLVDALLAFPGILLAILIVSILGGTIVNVIIALVVFSIPTFARLSRSAVLAVKFLDYITAAHAIGARPVWIIVHHVLPNILSPIIVYSTLRLATAILSGASLSFLGLGVSPPTPEWGLMVSAGLPFMRTHPHIIFFPGLAIFFTVLSINLLGDALRDVLDPKGRYD
jgi:peptide/nickel transport system permease protein